MSGWKFHTRRSSREKDESPEFDHREVYGASFATLERLCFREWPSIDSVGDIPPGEEKSAIFTFANRHDFETISLSAGEIVIPLSE